MPGGHVHLAKRRNLISECKYWCIWDCTAVYWDTDGEGPKTCQTHTRVRFVPTSWHNRTYITHVADKGACKALPIEPLLDRCMMEIQISLTVNHRLQTHWFAKLNKSMSERLTSSSTDEVGPCGPHEIKFTRLNLKKRKTSGLSCQNKTSCRFVPKPIHIQVQIKSLNYYTHWNLS